MIENVLYTSVIGGIAMNVILHVLLAVQTVLSFHSRLKDDTTWRAWRHLPLYHRRKWDWGNYFPKAVVLTFTVGFTATFIGYTFLVGLTVVLGL